MKGLGFVFTVLMMGFASQMIGQEAMTRSLNQTQTTTQTNKVTKTGAFGEVILISEEPTNSTTSSKESPVKYMDMMETETEAKTTPPVSKAVIFHGAKEITKESGFYIQLSITAEPLDKTHSIFQEFGNLKVQTMEDSIYCYLIGNFTTEATAQNFLKSVILARYPDATIVEFKKGERAN
jgi:hypothetical protein